MLYDRAPMHCYWECKRMETFCNGSNITQPLGSFVMASGNNTHNVMRTRGWSMSYRSLILRSGIYKESSDRACSVVQDAASHPCRTVFTQKRVWERWGGRFTFPRENLCKATGIQRRKWDKWSIPAITQSQRKPTHPWGEGSRGTKPLPSSPAKG